MTGPSKDLAFLDGGGTSAALIRTIDWSRSPLGLPAAWPDALKIAVSMALNSHFPKALTWGPERITIYNDAFRPILGAKPEAMGRPFHDIWAEAWNEIGPIADRAYGGEATFIEDFPLTIDRFGYPEDCTFTFCYSPVRDATGAVQGMMDTVIETTARTRTERQIKVLNRELAHRIKNTLAIVSTIARQTLRTAARGQEAEVLGNRLRAMGDAHALLTRGTSSEVDVAEVIRTALAPYLSDAARVIVAGPPVRLGERPALALSLAMNELATNAVKYGALSCEAGSVHVGWSVGPQGGRLVWTETGGPAVTLPERTSFGATLLTQVVPQDFAGRGEMDFRPEGLVYTLTATDGAEGWRRR